MTVDEIEQLIRRYLSTGVAVVVIAIGPGAEARDLSGLPGDPTVVTVEPTPAGGAPRAGSGRGTGSTSGGSGRTGSSRTPTIDPGGGPGARDGDDGSDMDPDLDSVDRSGGDGRTGGDGGATGGRSGRTPAPGGSTPDTGAAGRNLDDPEAPAPATGSRSAAPGTADKATTGDGITAAERHGWGSPNRVDDFDGGTEQWSIYDGPGHAGNGRRSPGAVSVADGILTITGDPSGTTAGMAWNPGQKYGRWEGRVRAPASDPSYNALLLLWPDAEDFPVGGEIDFMEMMDHTRQQTDLFIHYGPDNSQVHGKVEIDATQWHNWAVEWTPEAITAYVDGEEWYRTTDTSIFPPGPMHLCIQLDWFPKGDTPGESRMEVDWVRQYSLDGGGGGLQESLDRVTGTR